MTLKGPNQRVEPGRPGRGLLHRRTHTVEGDTDRSRFHRRLVVANQVVFDVGGVLVPAIADDAEALQPIAAALRDTNGRVQGEAIEVGAELALKSPA